MGQYSPGSAEVHILPELGSHLKSKLDRVIIFTYQELYRGTVPRAVSYQVQEFTSDSETECCSIWALHPWHRGRSCCYTIITTCRPMFVSPTSRHLYNHVFAWLGWVEEAVQCPVRLTYMYKHKVSVTLGPVCRDNGKSSSSTCSFSMQETSV